jgi:hypothetical protein
MKVLNYYGQNAVYWANLSTKKHGNGLLGLASHQTWLCRRKGPALQETGKWGTRHLKVAPPQIFAKSIFVGECDLSA